MSESTASWWVDLPRDLFYQRVREEAARLQTLTNDRRLHARGPSEKPAVRGGRTATAEGEA